MRRSLSVVLAIALLPGCATHQEHLCDGDHWWHAGPAWTGTFVGWFPFQMLGIVEDIVTGSQNWGMCPNPGVMGNVGLGAGYGLGVLLATPFFVLGLPFEGGQEEDPGPVPPVPPELREGSRP